MSRLFLRQFTDLDMFALAYAVVLTSLWYAPSLLDRDATTTGGVLFVDGLAPFVLSALAAVFVVLAVHHVFSSRTKTPLEAQYMLTMALAVVLFGALTLFSRALAAHLAVPLLALQGVYIAWLAFLIRHVNDDGEHLHARMIVSQDEARITVLLSAYVSFFLSVYFVYVVAYEWPLTLALLTTVSVPVARALEPCTHFLFSHRGTTIRTWLALVALTPPLILAVALGLLSRMV